MKRHVLIVLLLLSLLAPMTGRSAAETAKYTCGMHPMIVVDEPGLCPVCEMDLTPLKQGTGGGGDQVIQIDPVTSQKMGIRTAEAVERELVHTIQTVGLVDYEEPGRRAINSKVSGWVEELVVDQAGQAVTAGQPLLTIYSPELVAAQEELLLAQRNYRALRDSKVPGARSDAEGLLEAARRRLEYWDVSPAQIDRLLQSGEVEKYLTLYAPVGGVVSKKSVREGAYIAAGAEIMEISSLEQVWVFADIYEDEIAWLREGQAAEVRFPFAAEPVHGTIARVYPYLDTTTRTIKARIDLPNLDLRLKPDMYADVTIRTRPLEGSLAIPAEAVLYTGREETVFVALGEGRFEPRPVRTGRQGENGFVEVLSGLSAGDRVVTSAQFMLDSESKLREALQKMLAPAEPEQPDQESLDELF